MDTGKRFSNPRENGPARMLAVANAFLEIKTSDIPDALLPIHEKASHSQDNVYIMGSLEQYILYHQHISKILPKIKDMLSQSIIILVPSISADMPKPKNRISHEGFGYVENQPVSKHGSYPISSYFGEKLKNFAVRLEERIENISSDSFRDSIIKPVYYLPIGPIITLDYYDGDTIRNLFGEPIGGTDIIKAVDMVMATKGKKHMGSTFLSDDYALPFHEFVPGFYDAVWAKNKFRKPQDISYEEYIKELQLCTRYNRFITSLMYKEFFKILPEIPYPFLAKTSSLYHIASNAASGNLHDVSILRNAKMPLYSEAEDSAFNMLGGYILSRISGKRTGFTMDVFR